MKKLKEKISKGKIIVLAIIIVIFALLGFGLKYINDNYIGFIDIDMADLVFIDYNKQTFETTPNLDWVGNYYNSNGYYDDFVQKLENTGLYTSDQIDNYIPKLEGTTYSALESIYIDYGLSTENPLKNGDKLEVTINYNQEKAKEKKINITNNVISFDIKGLYDRVVASDLDNSIFDQVGGLKQIKTDALNNNLGIFDMTYEIPEYKFYLEDIDESSESTANLFQKLDIVYQEKDSYNKLDIEPDYYVCNRQFNVYKVEDQVKLEDANDIKMSCVESKSIDKTLSDKTKRESLKIENEYSEIKLDV